MFKEFESTEEYKVMFSRFEKLNDKTKSLIKGDFLDELDYRLDILEQSESPIEEILIYAILEKLSIDKMFVDVIPQVPVKLDKKTYRLDMTVAFYDSKTNRGCHMAVECDGHDFHEKTKEQVAKDKKRDRDLTKLGYTVVRFSGSEIYNNPYACAREIKSIAYSVIKGHNEKVN